MQTTYMIVEQSGERGNRKKDVHKEMCIHTIYRY